MIHDLCLSLSSVSLEEGLKNPFQERINKRQRKTRRRKRRQIKMNQLPIKLLSETPSILLMKINEGLGNKKAITFTVFYVEFRSSSNITELVGGSFGIQI